MSFIFITILSVAFVVFIIHKLANLAKAPLYWRSLVACALCAVAIDLILPILSMYLPNYQFIIIILITMIAAYYIAGYNNYLDKLAEAKKCRRFFPPEEQAAALAPANMQLPIVNSENLQTFDFSALSVRMPLLTATSESPADESGTSTENQADELEMPITNQPPAIPEDLPETKASEPDNKELQLDNPPVDTKAADTDSVTKHPVIAAESVNDTPPAADITDELSDDSTKSNTLPTETDKTDSDSAESQTDDSPVAIMENVTEVVEPDNTDDEENLTNDAIIADKLATLSELNDILDYAYELRNQKDLQNAIKAFKKALDNFPDNDYMPFVTIEIGNIYKAVGEYGKAITVYNKALGLPAVAADEVMKKEFINNIMYLRLLESALFEYKSQNLEFAAIPQKILQIVETNFQKWREQNL